VPRKIIIDQSSTFIVIWKVVVGSTPDYEQHVTNLKYS